MKEYICPNSEQHERDNRGLGGIKFVLVDVPPPHYAEIICTICGSHIKWASKAELREMEMGIESKDAELAGGSYVCPLLTIIHKHERSWDCLRENCAWWYSDGEICAILKIAESI